MAIDIRQEVLNVEDAADLAGLTVQGLRQSKSLGVKMHSAATYYTKREIKHYRTQKDLHYKQREPYNRDTEYEQYIRHQLMTGADVADMLGITPSAVTQNPDLQALKIQFNGRATFYIRDEIEAYANS